MEHDKNGNGLSISKLIDLLQVVVMCAVLPWGVWVTTTIYSYQAELKECKTWRTARPTFLSLSEANLMRMQTKEELRDELGKKLDKLMADVADMKLELTRHMAIKP